MSRVLGSAIHSAVPINELTVLPENRALTIKKLKPRAGFPGLHSEGWRWEGSHRQGCCLYLFL